MLSSVDGWLGIDTVGADFTVTDNLQLPTADANALRDAIDRTDIGGAITISGNAP